ncbi:hypothetical protein [Pasteurella multocida]|uniref:hypothetical protein n=1 Tax=Pasteurella multocida TaxID=747 RepID=UPI000CF21116|nr:hypothetical protein [Pasteurella multocida]MCL7786613.1 hypothetical protein [Pasteurella multocida]MCL7794604.1 hypothetical protein [Pasteurella multocida]MEB3458261.1 hypothetical protein [Pasteurella multocida]MEB3491493.1 hypothetical protein [Pasteurella multocida]MEB3492262.1 hypothetical protein [Pasteurella multocida]
MMNPITQMKVAKSTTEPNKLFKAKLEGYLSDGKPTLTLGKGNGLYVLYTQINRQFQLMKDSNQRCFNEFPDCYHHKIKLARECDDLAERLSKGLLMVEALAVGQTLNKEQKGQIKAFMRGAKYLISKLQGVSFNVDEVQRGEDE